MLPPDLTGAVAPEMDGGAQAAAGSDPAAMVDVAVEEGVATSERSTDPVPAEKSALVRLWWDRTAETADFKAAVEQQYKDMETLDGGTKAEQDDAAEVTINHVYRNALQTVALVVPEMTSITWVGREEVKPLPGMPTPPAVAQRKRQQQGLAAVTTTLFHRFAEMGNLQEKIEEYVQTSLHFRIGVVKCWFQRDLASDPVGEERLPDEQDLIARSRVLVELYDRGEFQKTDARYEEMRNCLRSIGRTEADVKRGIVIELRPLTNYRCDPSVTSPSLQNTAAWESDDILYTRDEILAKWSQISPDDLQRGVVYAVDETGRAIRNEREDKTTTSREVRTTQTLPYSKPSGDDWLLCREIYDYQTNTRLVLIEGLEYPAVEEPLELSPSGMSPFVLLVENPRPGSLYGYSDTELQSKAQRQLNRLRSQQEDARRNAQPRWAYDPSVINDQKVIDKIENAEPWSMIPVPVNGKGTLKDAILPLQGNHDYNPAEYDGQELKQEMHRMAMLPDDTLRSANFSSEVQSAAMTSSALARYRQARITRALKRLCDKCAQLILMNVNKDMAVRLAGPMAAEFWPDQPMDRREIYDGLTITVEVALDKQLDYAKRADSLAKLIDAFSRGGVMFEKDVAAKMLGKFMGLENEVDDLVSPDPNALVGSLAQSLQKDPGALAPESLMALIQIGQQAQQQAMQMAAQAMQQEAAQNPNQPPMPGA